MRKATIIFILIVFIGSIMLVNFFGLEYKSYNGRVFVEGIEIVDVNVSDGLKFEKMSEGADGYLWIYVKYEKNYKLRTGKDQILMITPRIIPDNATDKSIEIDTSSNDKEKESYYKFEEGTLAPTLIYQDNIDTSKSQIFKIIFINKLSGVKKRIKLYTTFVDSLNKWQDINIFYYNLQNKNRWDTS